MFIKLLLLLLLFLLRNVDGVVHLNDDTVDDGGSGSNKDEIPCCNSGNSTFYSIVDALNNVTSNSIINISTDVVLSSNVTLDGLDNITITGQEKPTVYCNDIGSLKFVSCNNVTIKGVNWERCGFVENSSDLYDYHHDYSDFVPNFFVPNFFDYYTNQNNDIDHSNNQPGIEINNSSNIIIQSCSFHHSVGQAVALSKVSGNVYISNCQFTHNKYHKGHGAAIYYTSSPEPSAQTQLVVNNCNFTLNGPAESIVYIENQNGKLNNHVSILQNSAIIQNQGTPIYILYTSLILNNSVSFKDNKATAGGGIHSSNSIIKFDDKCNVSFYNNSVSDNGGAIYLTHSKILFRMDAVVMFTNNSAVRNDYNYRSGLGGAIHSEEMSLISFEDQSLVTFINNTGDLEGGALFVEQSDVIFCGNSTVIFSNNSAGRGGVIQVWYDSVMSFGENSTVRFTGNSATAEGGAIQAYRLNITFHGNSAVTFSNNSARRGGALFLFDDQYLPRYQGNSIDTLRKCDDSTFIEGALSFEYNSIMSFGGNSTVTFTGNSGGAVEVTGSNTMFHGNSVVTFTKNSARHDGGAIRVGPGSVAFFGNSKVTFSRNHAMNGGAIMISMDWWTTDIFVTECVTVIFNNNSATN